jgi:hypothetical protein
MKYIKTDQQILIKELLNNTEFDLFVTLTFPWSKHRKTHDDIAPTLNAFFRHVETKCFGRQSKKISRFPVIEYSKKEDATHIHVLMMKPENKTHLEFRCILRSKWVRLDGTGKSNMGNQPDKHGKSWYEVIGSSQKDSCRVEFYTSKDIEANYDTAIFQCMKVEKATST